MEVVIDGKKYVIAWKHDLVARVTTCIVTVVQPGGSIASCFAAISKVHPKDQYVKEIGRRYSLKAILAELWPDPEKPEDVAAARAKARAYRREIWEAYWARKKPKKEA